MNNDLIFKILRLNSKPINNTYYVNYSSTGKYINNLNFYNRFPTHGVYSSIWIEFRDFWNFFHKHLSRCISKSVSLRRWTKNSKFPLWKSFFTILRLEMKIFFFPNKKDHHFSKSFVSRVTLDDFLDLDQTDSSIVKSLKFS